MAITGCHQTKENFWLREATTTKFCCGTVATPLPLSTLWRLTRRPSRQSAGVLGNQRPWPPEGGPTAETSNSGTPPQVGSVTTRHFFQQLPFQGFGCTVVLNAKLKLWKRVLKIILKTLWLQSVSRMFDHSQIIFLAVLLSFYDQYRNLATLFITLMLVSFLQCYLPQSYTVFWPKLRHLASFWLKIWNILMKITG